jgi:type I site-specific restriction endonuclease
MEAELQALALPDHGIKTKHGPLGVEVFDPIRRRWVLLTPEEWVRQHFINHLVHDKGCPASLVSVERSLQLNGMARRTDILLHDATGSAIALVECKAPSVKIGQAALEQAARYNLIFKVPYLLVTNGRTHYSFSIDHQQKAAQQLKGIPSFGEMCDRTAR